MGFGKDKKGVIFRQRDIISLDSLGATNGVKQDNPPAVIDSLRIIKSEGSGSVATGGTTGGPVELWLVSDDLSVAEIQEAISSGGGQPLNRGDVVGDARALRPVFYLTQVEMHSATAGAVRAFEWSETIRWTFGEATAFSLFAFNSGIAAVNASTQLRFNHTAFGVWVGA